MSAANLVILGHSVILSLAKDLSFLLSGKSNIGVRLQFF
jgi:hypothetical protein